MQDKIFDFISDKYKLSGGNCGIYITELHREFGIASKELSKILNSLFKEKKIKVSEGVHGKMAMLNKPKVRFFKSRNK